jgi:hypothetical protein
MFDLVLSALCLLGGGAKVAKGQTPDQPCPQPFPAPR